MALQSRRVACINARFSDILCDHSSGSDHYSIADCDGQNGRVRPDTNLVPDLCWSPEIAPPLCRPSDRKEIIDEHGTVRDEAVFSDGHELADKCVRLNTASFCDEYPVL